MKSKVQVYWLLALIPLIFLAWFIYAESNTRPLRLLPYYGPKHAGTKKDSAYHEIKAFRFTDQNNNSITLNNLKNNIVVVEFFFTTCQSICPIMNSNLQKVYKRFADRNDVLLLSHTVDPEVDSVAALKAYASLMGVTDSRWLFVTGNKKELYEAARTSYLLNSDKGDGGADDFIHTQKFALIDKNQHIRGYYDGTDTLEVNRLITEMELLIQEHDAKENSVP